MRKEPPFDEVWLHPWRGAGTEWCWEGGDRAEGEGGGGGGGGGWMGAGLLAIFTSLYSFVNVHEKFNTCDEI